MPATSSTSGAFITLAVPSSTGPAVVILAGRLLRAEAHRESNHSLDYGPDISGLMGKKDGISRDWLRERETFLSLPLLYHFLAGTHTAVEQRGQMCPHLHPISHSINSLTRFRWDFKWRRGRTEEELQGDGWRQRRCNVTAAVCSENKIVLISQDNINLLPSFAPVLLCQWQEINETPGNRQGLKQQKSWCPSEAWCLSDYFY